jgi:hypothetical protein
MARASRPVHAPPQTGYTGEGGGASGLDLCRGISGA